MFIATFHSHFGAISTANRLKQNGVEVKLQPVPRKISSSCGTCIAFSTQNIDFIYQLLDEETDAVYDLSFTPALLVMKRD